ncbi:MAG: hypothetical protein MZU84_05825 [Sphingobacterium sp.]|nr:hypothetical protein [Sphingobacterium sp.]
MRRDGKVYHHFYGDGQGEFTEHCDDPLWFILAVTEYLKETGDFGAARAPRSPSSTGERARSSSTCWPSSASPAPTSGPTACRGSGGATGTTRSTTSAARTAARASGARCSTRPCSTGSLELLAHRRKAAESASGGPRAPGPAGRGDRDPRLGRRVVRPGLRRGRAGRSARRRTATGRSSSTPRAGPSSPDCRTAAGPSGRWTAWPASSTRPSGPRSAPRPSARSIRRSASSPAASGARRRTAPSSATRRPGPSRPSACSAAADGPSTYFRKLLPGRIDQAIFCAEPYVYSQYITSDEHETAGRASHSWQTGTAAWMYRVAYDHILGVRPAYGGLRRRSGHPGGLAGLPRRARLPGRALPRRGREPGRRRVGGPVDRGRRPSRSRAASSRRVRPDRSAASSSRWAKPADGRKEGPPCADIPGIRS